MLPVIFLFGIRNSVIVEQLALPSRWRQACCNSCNIKHVNIWKWRFKFRLLEPFQKFVEVIPLVRIIFQVFNKHFLQLTQRKKDFPIHAAERRTKAAKWTSCYGAKSRLNTTGTADDSDNIEGRFRTHQLRPWFPIIQKCAVVVMKGWRLMWFELFFTVLALERNLQHFKTSCSSDI